jgi:erythromycin esterase-like protein
MDATLWLGIGTAAGTLIIQIMTRSYIAGQFSQQFSEMEKWKEKEAIPMLDEHERDLHDHDKRLTVIERGGRYKEMPEHGR